MRTPPFPTSETQPLKGKKNGKPEQDKAPKSYGSFVSTPSAQSKHLQPELAPFNLPDPALNPDQTRSQAELPAEDTNFKKNVSMKISPPSSDAYHVGPTQTPRKKALNMPRHLFRPSRTISTPEATATSTSPFMKRMFSGVGVESPRSQDVPLEAYQELDDRQDDFFGFLDQELDKIESFYKSKEDEASKRLHLLRAQLHEMRDRRVEEVLMAQDTGQADKQASEDPHSIPNGDSHNRGPGLLKPLGDLVSSKPNVGKTTEAMTQLGSPSKSRPASHDARRDYVRRVDQNEHVPYRSAKRKLKLALQEFYRALELLKSYALVNRTAFRKINKKYDKAVNARPTGRYMTEKVNKTYFVKSETIDSFIVAVEDLYARYFERGNRKIAVQKLRSKITRSGDFSQTSFRNGIWVAAGTALGIQGIVYGVKHLKYHGNPAIRLQTSYLLQLYGGYFLGLLLFLLFTLDCRVWTRSKINYIFVFEYDSRNVLDWRELAELPCFFLFLNGLFIWLNFRQGGEDVMYIYWPVILVGLTLIVMCNPLRLLYHGAESGGDTHTGDFYWLAYTRWSSATSSWAICTAL